MFAEAAASIVASLRSTPPAPGFERVLVPGELEATHARRASSAGIALSEPLVVVLSDLGRRLGVGAPVASEVPEVDA